LKGQSPSEDLTRLPLDKLKHIEHKIRSMGSHSKNLLTYLPYCLVPLLLLAALNYWNGLRTVDSTLSALAQSHLNSLAGEIDRRLQTEKHELSRAALAKQLQDITSEGQDASPVSLSNASPDAPAISSDLKFILASVLKGRGHCFRLTVFDQVRRPVIQIERQENARGPDTFTTSPGDPSLAPSFTTPVKREVLASVSGTTLKYVVPIVGGDTNQRAGALVSEVNLDQLIAEASNALNYNPTQHTFVTVIDPSSRIIYHTNRDIEGKLVSSALPEFLPIAESLARGNSGLNRFSAANKNEFLTAFSPLPQWNIGLAVGYDRSALASKAHIWGIGGLLVALISGFLSALLISHRVQKKSLGIERVEEGLTAIAKGELDRRIELKSSDDARIIADSINVVTERLRAQIAREEETRQFQSFVRLSAMLTHDLKNAIEALSLIVGNMERHFDNEQFRRDALRSLTSATDKLKGIVIRLSRPLSSLSGEHPRPMSVDLVPILKRVAAMTAEPVREKHDVELKLPRSLFVYTDPERIENVVENLILNALEAMADKHGKLTIEAGLTSRGAATFSVSDTGPGMSKTFIEKRLFRPFSTTKKHGVGLGLYTCREVVEASAGLIEVDSVEGSGTTFRVVLPSASHDSRN
jgi:signal transduction histidine kinase